MIDYLKENWKTAVAGLIVAIVIAFLCCSNSEEVAPVKELSDKEIEEVF